MDSTPKQPAQMKRKSGLQRKLSIQPQKHDLHSHGCGQPYRHGCADSVLAAGPACAPPNCAAPQSQQHPRHFFRPLMPKSASF